MINALKSQKSSNKNTKLTKIHDESPANTKITPQRKFISTKKRKSQLPKTHIYHETNVNNLNMSLDLLNTCTHKLN